mgnify:FL=1
MTSVTTLKTFRKRVYCLLGNGRDSLFDLMDAVLTSRTVSSFVELSLSPVFRRTWSSVYKVLERGAPPRQKLMQLYRDHLPVSETSQLVLAGDHTAWPRLWSPTLKERTYEHEPAPGPGSKPVTVGQGYSSLVCLPEVSGSWVLPLLHERITSFETPIEKAARQLKQVCAHLSHRPLSLWDSEYGCASFVQLTATIACDKLMRLRPNRVLYGPPKPYGGRGRPSKHGRKFTLKAPDSWWTADETVHANDEKLGSLRVRRWANVHFKQASDHPLELILVERLDTKGHCTHRPLWLIWTGHTMPPLNTLWSRYLKRFCIEHWYRFIRQRLHWCLPHLGTAKQTETWSDLIPIMSWQLWMARHHTLDSPLPWQKPQERKTPGRVANGFAALLVTIGTPAEPPKTRGKSPGWPSGKLRPPRQQFPTVKKTYSKPKAEPKLAA